MQAQKLKKSIYDSEVISDPETFEKMVQTAYQIATSINPINPDVSGFTRAIIEFEFGYPELDEGEDLVDENQN